VLALCVPRSESFATLAGGLALMRVAVALVLAFLAWRASPALFRGTATLVRGSMRVVALPSAAFMILPTVYVLNLQGYTLIVGAAFGAKLVAGFVATRVIVRAVDLVMSVIYASQFNEAGYLGPEKREIQRRQLATMTSITLIGVLVFSLAIVLFGPWFQHVLSAGKSAFDLPVAVVLLVSGLIRALATTPQALVSAENKHMRFAANYLVASLVCLPIAATLAFVGMPLPVVLLLLIPAELAQTIPAFRATLDHLEWGKRDLLRAMVHRERLTDLVRLVQFLVHRR
jgi:O-antigen/teichoic acid export membrane protein